MKISTRIVVFALFAVLISAVGNGPTAQRASACGGLAQAVDCYDAASLSYSPSNPGAGDYVYINVVIDATVSNVAYYYTCEGQQYPVFMTIPGRSCDGSSAGLLGCWRFINHYFFPSTPKGNPKGVCGALKDTFWDLSGTVIEKTMGDYFETWKVSR